MVHREPSSSVTKLDLNAVRVFSVKVDFCEMFTVEFMTKPPLTVSCNLPHATQSLSAASTPT